jgi:hypothetical protein
MYGVSAETNRAIGGCDKIASRCYPKFLKLPKRCMVIKHTANAPFFGPSPFNLGKCRVYTGNRTRASVVGDRVRRPIAFAISSSSRERALGGPSVRVHRGYDCTYLRTNPRQFDELGGPRKRVASDEE